ncbi:hypothetical protein AB0O01_01520 [Streptomyces sp. NPDC093252]|uniref:hypothetical protein n=1 Tax=Streptomyces sp. NPDC093252 TaxID=3154980 RepID=UPI0034357A14
MIMPPVLPPRHPLLPERERSRAVLVGSSAGLRHAPSLGEPEALAGRLARVLTAPGPGGAFHRGSTRAFPGVERPDEVLDALRESADAASDVLLVWFAGGPDSGIGLDAVAGIVGASRAARPVVLLDCGQVGTALAAFAAAAPTASVMAAGTSSFWPLSDPFTETLIDGLVEGVQDGPEALDLATLRHAIEAVHTRTRYYVENEHIGGPSRVLLEGDGTRVALGLNPAYGVDRPGALPPHPDVVDAQESW